MRLWAFLFFLLPIFGCIYVGWHVWRLLPLAPVWKSLIVALMASCFVLFVMNFVIGLDRVPLTLAKVMYAVGNSSIFILLYLVMLFLLLDFGRLVHLVPPTFLKNSVSGSLSVLGIMVALFTYANIHYNNKVRVPMEVNTEGRLERPLRLVMMSDLHLGYHNSRADLAKWVDKINAEQPDLVLVGGDIIDISVRPLIEENMAEEFRRLKAPVYACLGNHEYYSGEPRAQQFYKDAGIHLLRDEVVTLPEFGNLTIIGRDDRTNAGRKSVAELMKNVSSTQSEGVGGKAPYTILLDHQPYHLERSEAAGIDFQFSGHTHYGQVWPISWIEDAMYECAYGSLTKGKTHVYVTSGIGIWGAKFRIGTQSEYLVLSLR
ncbi:MAG: metallophosphoesterase [Prevotella sp.]|nr:metallophosphoesterase [Prevotella sp.]